MSILAGLREVPKALQWGSKACAGGGVAMIVHLARSTSLCANHIEKPRHGSEDGSGVKWHNSMRPHVAEESPSERTSEVPGGPMEERSEDGGRWALPALWMCQAKDPRVSGSRRSRGCAEGGRRRRSTGNPLDGADHLTVTRIGIGRMGVVGVRIAYDEIGCMQISINEVFLLLGRTQA